MIRELLKTTQKTADLATFLFSIHLNIFRPANGMEMDIISKFKKNLHSL